jgi:hypothetical protein
MAKTSDCNNVDGNCTCKTGWQGATCVEGSGGGVQHYVIKFVSDFRQVGGFLWVLRFLPPIKLTEQDGRALRV